MVKYSYYPGNVARQSSAEVEDTIQPLCKTLGIELIEIIYVHFLIVLYRVIFLSPQLKQKA